MDTLVTEALRRLDHPSPADVLTAAVTARIGYEGEVSPGAKRTRSVDPKGSVRVNEFLLSLVFSVSEDGVAQPIVDREADFAVLAILQGEFAHQTRISGLSAEERSIGYGCIVSEWKGAGTGGMFLSSLYQTRKAYAALADHSKTQISRLQDLITVVEHLLGDPQPETLKSAAGVSALFSKRR